MVALAYDPAATKTSMTGALSRKRSRLDVESEDDDGDGVQNCAVALKPIAELKRSKRKGELDEIGIIAPEEAWLIDVPSILSMPTVATTSEQRQAHNNASRYVKGESIIVLCVQGNLLLHYDLLCAMLPDLYALSPSLQALVLCRDPATHVPSTTTAFSLPLIQGVQGSVNHFVRLGLLHPLGGGHFPLEALVVLDKKGRRRLVLPFGWGAGKHAGTPAGKGIQRSLMGMLRQCIEALLLEE